MLFCDSAEGAAPVSAAAPQIIAIEIILCHISSPFHIRFWLVRGRWRVLGPNWSRFMMIEPEEQEPNLLDKGKN